MATGLPQLGQKDDAAGSSFPQYAQKTMIHCLRKVSEGDYQTYLLAKTRGSPGLERKRAPSGPGCMVGQCIRLCLQVLILLLAVRL